MDDPTYNWRYLTVDQRAACIMALEREQRRLKRLALKTPPGSKRLYRSANAGACRVLVDMLREIGGHP